MGIEIRQKQPLKFGRPPSVKTMVDNELKEVMLAVVQPRFKEIIEAQVEAAVGFKKTVLSKSGEVVVTQENPDVQAARLVLEYTMEKPKQTLEHQGSVNLIALVAQLEHGDTNKTN